MTDHEKNKPNHSLDEVLALMSEEVPPMPADFHEKWTKAVREEAAKSETKPEKENSSRVILINRWTRILSVAAVFVFLIGGTLIYRSSRPKTTALLTAPKEQETVLMKADERTQEDLGASFDPEAAEEGNDPAAEAPAAVSHMAAMEAEAVMEEAAEADAVTEEAAEADRPMMSLSASGASKDNAAMMDAESEETADAAMAIGAGKMEITAEEAPVNDAAAPMPAVQKTPDPTREPAPESDRTEAAVREDKTAPAAKAETEIKEQPGLLQSIGGFFGDMGAFLLTVWPYLLILAVPAAAALLYRKKKRQH